MKEYLLAIFAAMCSVTSNANAEIVTISGPVGSVTVFEPPVGNVYVGSDTPIVLGEWVLGTDKVERVRYISFAFEFIKNVRTPSNQCPHLSTIDLYLYDGKHRRKIGSGAVSYNTVLIKAPDNFMQPKNSLWKLQVSTKFINGLNECVGGQLNLALKNINAYGASSVVQLPVVIPFRQVSWATVQAGIATPRIYNMTVSPNYLIAAGNTTISWNTGMNSCTLNGLEVMTNGSRAMYIDKSTQLTLSCKEGEQTDTRTTFVQVGT